MLGRVFCYFCEALINADDEGFCPHCYGTMERTLDREWQRKEIDGYYTRSYSKPNDAYFVAGGNCVGSFDSYYVDGGSSSLQGKYYGY